jgi:predicted ATP-dependent endonuclease of OLD family
VVRIRKIEIKHFRSICSLDWNPVDGVNCLIGPGDSGKSTILDAIDLCLGARRNLSLADTMWPGETAEHLRMSFLRVDLLPAFSTVTV